MAVLDVFNSDAFNLHSLTAAVNKIPYVPTRIEELGIFSKEPETNIHVDMEFDEGVIYLVSNQERGSGAHTAHADENRDAFTLKARHLPVRTSVLADDVQGLRAFGTENIAETVAGRVEKKIAAARRSIRATLEHHRIGAIRGQVLDADGSTVMYNLETLFGVTQPTVTYSLDVSTTDVRAKCMETWRTITKNLGGTPFTRVHALCGDGFFDALIGHDEVKARYDNWANNVNTANFAYRQFEFGGIMFENYRGTVGSVSYVPDDRGFAFPIGVEGMFVHHMCPADYIETVNTPGREFYAKQMRMDFDKGIEIEVQADPLIINHRPEAVVELEEVS